MSGARFLLLFLGEDDAGWTGWMRLADGLIVERGTNISSLSPIDERDEPENVVLVVPGTDVLLHWVDLPPLAPAQAIAAARLLAAEVSATPPEQLHVAVGVGGGTRCIAVVEADLARSWIEATQAIGYDPDHILPEPLLILPPREGVRRWAHDGLHLLRGRIMAMTAEPALATLAEEEPVETIDSATIEEEIGAALDHMTVDLRQGTFAKRKRWRIDWGLMRRLAAIAIGIFLVTLLIQAVLITRYSMDSSRLEREMDLVARSALPRGVPVNNPSVQLSERLAELRGGGLGFGTSAALLFAAVKDTANVELSQLLFDRDGVLRVTVLAPSNADISALQSRLEAQGLDVDSAAFRSGGGRQMADFVVTTR
jgi:general secretion pathway protein L